LIFKEKQIKKIENWKCLLVKITSQHYLKMLSSIVYFKIKICCKFQVSTVILFFITTNKKIVSWEMSEYPIQYKFELQTSNLIN